MNENDEIASQQDQQTDSAPVHEEPVHEEPVHEEPVHVALTSTVGVAVADTTSATVVTPVNETAADAVAANPNLAQQGVPQVHPGHAIIDEILHALHVQNPGAWMRNKLEELRKTL